MIECAVEQSKCSLRLIVRDFVTGLVDAEETQVAVLTHFAVLGAVDGEGLVACCGEFGAVGVVEGEGDCLAAEPVADVIGVTKRLSEAFRMLGTNKRLTRRTD
jgi:hypothetical protein